LQTVDRTKTEVVIRKTPQTGTVELLKRALSNVKTGLPGGPEAEDPH